MAKFMAKFILLYPDLHDGRLCEERWEYFSDAIKREDELLSEEGVAWVVLATIITEHKQDEKSTLSEVGG